MDAVRLKCNIYFNSSLKVGFVRSNYTILSVVRESSLTFLWSDVILLVYFIFY